MESSPQPVAMVTGAGSGIGRAVARELAAEGHALAVVDVKEESAKQTANLISSSGGIAEAFVADVTSRESMENAERAIRDRLGVATIIVNGAGWNVGQPFLKNEPEFMERVVALNFMGPVIVCQTFLRPIVEAGMSGSVVNISSDAGRVGSLGETVYAGSKAGVIGLTKSLAREMARHSINVNCVCPGPTDTALFALQPPKIQEALIRAIPLRRLARPEEVAHVVTFFASDKASYMTGQIVSVSGGLTLAG